MWCHVVWTTGNNISEQPTVCTFLISPSHSLLLLFCYPEDGGSRLVSNCHTSFQKFPTCPQHMGIDTRSVVTQLSLGGLLQFKLNKAGWRSACQMHAIVYFTLQITDGGGGAKMHSYLTFWHWMSHQCSHGMKCQNAKVCSPKLSCKIFSCDTFVLELFHLKLQAIAHITINHRPPSQSVLLQRGVVLLQDTATPHHHHNVWNLLQDWDILTLSDQDNYRTATSKGEMLETWKGLCWVEDM